MQYTVYHAKDQFGKDVFLKSHRVAQILLRDQAQLEIEMSQRDAKIIARLDGNPHVLSYHSYFQNGDDLVLVMDYLEHVQLAKRMKEKRPLEEKLEILRTIFGAIRTFHRVGVYHRDLHPQNIVFATDGQIKFLNFDFGVNARFNMRYKRTPYISLPRSKSTNEIWRPMLINTRIITHMDSSPMSSCPVENRMNMHTVLITRISSSWFPK
ncbi:MAG: protein kinase domain-containing protein [Sulfobacillus sp.]